MWVRTLYSGGLGMKIICPISCFWAWILLSACSQESVKPLQSEMDIVDTGLDDAMTRDVESGIDSATVTLDASWAKNDLGAVLSTDARTPHEPDAESDAQTSQASDVGRPGDESDSALDMAPPEDMAVEPPGHTPSSCGDPEFVVEPVDCTSAGDLSAMCIFSHHCMCSAGFVCAMGSDVEGTEECAPGDICVPMGPDGSRPDNCGSEDNGNDPVDCTKHGDEWAICVFGDHCLCSERFVCLGDEVAQAQRECQRSTSCIPRDDGPLGSTRYSCGSPDQGLDPVNCTEFGDFGAVCIFSNHCGCSDGYVCEEQAGGGPCEPGQRCQPVNN